MSQIILQPKISEKAMFLADHGQYVFEVPMSTNKIEVKKAVEASFKVSVTGVTIIIAKGKVKRFKQIKGTQKDVKKAIVTLQKGQTIGIFEGAK
jgi:large subunit ribosomal protein L23